MKIEKLENDCTGCTACVSVCPVKSINIEMDAEGFYYPKINKDTCISCGKCEEVCHCLHPIEYEKEYYSYYGRSKEAEILLKSSSGGAFYHLARVIQKENGVIYGACLDYEDLFLKHKSTNEIELDQLLKSKYIESNMEKTILKIKEDLQKGKKVLFCGTPCQVSGLKRVIKKNKELLITCDFLCHGVPSSKLFVEHINNLIKNEKIYKIDFRPKDEGWTSKYIYIYTNKRIIKKPYYFDSYYAGFMQYNAFLRKSCYHCKFRIDHCADITLGDFWGYRNYKPEINDEKGLSLIVVNTIAGKEIIEKIENFDLHKIENKYSEYAFLPKDYTDAYNLRKEFYEEYEKSNFEKAAKKTYMKGIWKKKIKEFIKKIINY